MGETKSNRLWPPLIFFLALMLRLAYIYQVEPLPFSSTLILDASSEDRWGQEIASGDWLGKSKGIFYTDPLYAYFLGLIYFIFGHDLTAARVVQAVVDSGTCVLIFFLGRMVFNQRIGLLSSILASAYGPFVYYQAFIMKTTLTLFFLTIFLLTVLKAMAKEGNMRWLLSGLSLGLVAMTRGNILLFAPLVILYILFCRGSGFLKRGTYMLIFLAGLIAALLPVASRNYIYGNAFVLTAPSIGMNFYIGNNPSAAGGHTPIASVRAVPEREAEDAARVASIAAGKALNSSEVSLFWLNKGIDFAVKEPIKFLRLLGRKFLLFWNHYEVPDVYNYYLFMDMVPLLSFLINFGALAPLGIAGMLISFRGVKRGRILTGFILAYMASLIVFYITSRYRLPVTVMLLPFSAYTMVTISEWLKRKAFRKVAAGGTVLAAALVFVNLNIVDESVYISQSHTGLGNIYYQKGRMDEAEMEYRTALKLNPKNYDGLNNLAYIYAEKGINLDEALSLVRQALRSNPISPEFLDTEAYIYLRTGKVEDARVAILKAISIDPKDRGLLKRLEEIEGKR